MNSAQIDKKGKKKNHRGPSSASAHKAHSSRSNLIGDLLYMYGFWVEYIFVCAYRKAHAVVKGIASTLGNLLMVVLRPVLLGIITFCEDLISPFTRMASGIRHIRELPQELSDAGSDQIRAAKKAYVRSGGCAGGRCPQRPGASFCVERPGQRRKRRLRSQRANF